MTVSGILKGVAAGLFVLSLPVLFGTTSNRWLWSDTGWYRTEFDKYGVSATTGISPAELATTADAMSKYLMFQRDRVDDIVVTIGGKQVPLFNDRENKHMADVKALLGRFYTLQVVSGAYVLLYLIVSPLWLGRAYRASVGRGLRWGGGLTLAMFGLLGAVSMLDFSEMWTRFHLVAFDNDLWQLDPTKDRLIMMAPEGTWYDSAVRLALTTGGQAALSIVLGFILGRRRRGLSFQKSIASN
ncbi:MAG TPA: TIGR01906 family membrane protein [Chloroflexota bacterium]